VFDLTTMKQAFTATMDAKYLTKVKSVNLLSDDDYVFVAVNQETDPQQVAPMWNPNGTQSNGVLPNVLPTSGLRFVPVNGQVIGFDLAGKKRWEATVENQFLVTSSFEEMPGLFFTSRFNKMIRNPGFVTQSPVTQVRALAKHNGKLWFDRDTQNAGMNLFFGLTMDHTTGTMSAINSSQRIELYTVPRTAPK
jgi:hypothetical protein